MRSVIQRIHCTSDGQLLAAIGNELSVFDLEDGQCKLSTDFSCDNEQLWAATQGKGMQSTLKRKFDEISELKEGDLRAEASGDGGIISQILFLPTESAFLILTPKYKVIRLVQASDHQVICQRVLPKRPSAMSLTDEGQTVLVADKFGDIYALNTSNLRPATFGTENRSRREPACVVSDSIPKSSACGSCDNDNCERSQHKGIDHSLAPIMGHVSLVSCLAAFNASSGQAYIVTGDRDEHIRITRYPEAHCIENFLLEHESYIAGLLLIPASYRESSKQIAPASLGPQKADINDRLVSIGGDGIVCIWDPLDGRLLEKIELEAEILSFLERGSGGGLRQYMRGVNALRAKKYPDEPDQANAPASLTGIDDGLTNEKKLGRKDRRSKRKAAKVEQFSNDEKQPGSDIEPLANPAFTVSPLKTIYIAGISQVLIIFECLPGVLVVEVDNEDRQRLRGGLIADSSKENPLAWLDLPSGNPVDITLGSSSGLGCVPEIYVSIDRNYLPMVSESPGTEFDEVKLQAIEKFRLQQCSQNRSIELDCSPDKIYTWQRVTEQDPAILRINNLAMSENITEEFQSEMSQVMYWSGGLRKMHFQYAGEGD